MALLACPDCGRAVSDQAPACPGCGRPAGAGAAPFRPAVQAAYHQPPYGQPPGYPQPIARPAPTGATPEQALPHQRAHRKNIVSLVVVAALLLVGVGIGVVRDKNRLEANRGNLGEPERVTGGLGTPTPTPLPNAPIARDEPPPATPGPASLAGARPGNRGLGERCSKDCECESLECKGFKCVARDFVKHPLRDQGASCGFNGDCRSCDCSGFKCR